MNLTINNEQKVHIKLAPTTAAGNPAKIDGPATFTVTSGDATVEADADGLGAFLVSGADPGLSEISVSADVDFDEGEVNLVTDTVTLTVVAAEAAEIGLVADAPILK